ncbi:unnamed protein product, partial [Ascophyllum nodosum]
LVLVIKGWACYVLICHQQKRTFGGRRTSSRGFASFLHEKRSPPLLQLRPWRRTRTVQMPRVGTRTRTRTTRLSSLRCR